MEIQIAVQGLPSDTTIHLVGSAIGWRLGLAYPEPEDGKTTLTFDSNVIGVEFKHFVFCGINQQKQVRNILRLNGYEVTGFGDQYGNRWRVWFLLPNYPTSGVGVYTNNTFNE